MFTIKDSSDNCRLSEFLNEIHVFDIFTDKANHLDPALFDIAYQRIQNHPKLIKKVWKSFSKFILTSLS